MQPSPQAAKHALANTIFKNTTFVMLGNALLKVIDFLFKIYVVRRLGDDRFGQYSTVIAFATLFQILGEMGMSQYVMREIARDKSNTQKYFWNLIVVRFLLSSVSVFVITLAAYLNQYNSEIVLGVFIYTCSFLIAAFQSPIQMVLTANERFDYVSAMNIIGQLIFVMFGAYFLYSGYGYVWIIAGGLISLLIQMIIGFWAAYKNGYISREVHIQANTWWSLIKYGLPFGIISISLTIAYNLDTVILSKFASSSEVGWYNVAYSLVFTVLFVSTSFKEAMTPSLAKTYATDPDQVENWYFRIIKVIILISLPIAVGGMIVSSGIIQFLYSDEYAPAARAFQIIIWDVPFLMFASFCGNITTIIKKERVGARVYVLASIANVILNLLIIPRYGFMGAAVTTILTDLIAAIQFHIYLKRKLNLPNLMSVLMRILLATGTMGIVIYLLRDRNFIILIGLGAVLYTLLIFLFRVLDQSEINIIKKIINKIVPVLSLKPD